MTAIRWTMEKSPRFSEQRRSEIAALWDVDTVRNPFTAPAYLAAIAESAPQHAITPVLAEGRNSDGMLMAVWPLRMELNGRLGFLQYVHCDQCTCLYRPEVPVDELAEGFAAALRELKPKTAEMRTVPEWSHTLEAMREGFRRSGWRACDMLANICPIVEGEGTEEGRKAFKKRFDTKSWRRHGNRAKREEGYAIEVYEGGEELEEWVRDFCEAHEMRWNDTSTPSRYQSRQARDRLQSVLEGWLAEGLLIRFALWIGDRRAAQIVALRRGQRLIYHHVTRRPDMDKLNVGKALLRAMAYWMADNGYTCLDLGLGDEGYKGGVATAEEPLWRIYASARTASPFYLRACLEKKVRSSPRLLSAARALKKGHPGRSLQSLLSGKSKQD